MPIAPASQPRTFRLSLLWTSTDVKSPGNLLVYQAPAGPDAAPHIAVIDGWHEIVEIDPATGKQLARHTDLTNGQPPVALLETAVDAQGRRVFVVGGVGQQQFHVFDSDWNPILDYPPEGSGQVFSVLPADLDGDGKLELNVGYFGPAGVQGVSLAGKRLWRCGALENVSDLTITDPDAAGKRRLLCTNQQGTVVPVAFGGVTGPPLRLTDRGIVNVLGADLDGDGKYEYCGIAIDGAGNRSVFGFKLDAHGGRATWQQTIPRGEHQYPVRLLTAARLLPGQSGQWLVAAADGSVHIIAADGASHDEFNSGKALTGLASTTIGGKPALLLSSPDGLQALAVEPKP